MVLDTAYVVLSVLVLSRATAMMCEQASFKKVAVFCVVAIIGLAVIGGCIYFGK